jgi:hypothetical protein
MSDDGGPTPRRGFPIWGSLAIPGGILWGLAIGILIGLAFGNVLIGALIGLGLGVGIGLVLFAAAVVVASANL